MDNYIEKIMDNYNKARKRFIVVNIISVIITLAASIITGFYGFLLITGVIGIFSGLLMLGINASTREKLLKLSKENNDTK